MSNRPCVDCGRDTRPQRHPELTGSAHQARGLCSGCYTRHQRAGTLLDHEGRQRTRDEVLDEWATLRMDGHTIPQAAPRLGMGAWALLKALERAKQAGDPRARFDYRGIKALKRSIA